MKIKKEIYFDSDIFEEVANRHNIKESIVKDAFNSYISSFKKYIENTDYISYRMPYMGEMLISLSASKREMEKYKRRYLREKDELKKESLKNIYLNYRLKLKKVKIETEKGKRFGKYKIAGAKRRTVNRKMKLKNGDSFLKLMGTGDKLLSSIKKQNDYAYNHYNRKNLNPSTF